MIYLYNTCAYVAISYDWTSIRYIKIRQAGRQAGRLTGKQAGVQAGRETGRLAGRRAGGYQTDRGRGMNGRQTDIDR